MLRAPETCTYSAVVSVGIRHSKAPAAQAHVLAQNFVFKAPCKLLTTFLRGIPYLYFPEGKTKGDN